MPSIIRATTTSGLQVAPDNSGSLQLQTNGTTTAVTIDTSQNVGIGTASPTVKLEVNSASNPEMRINDGTVNLQLYAGTGTSSAVIGTIGSHALAFRTNATERMRIDSSGNVGIGTTSPASKLDVVSATNEGIRFTDGTRVTKLFNSSGISAGALWVTSNDALSLGTNNTERMRIDSSGEVYIAGTTDRGAFNLQCNGTGVWGAGAYTNGSDARIKENITPIDSGLDVVAKLNPVTYKYKEDWSKDQSIQTGFIAQDLLVALEGKNYVDGIVNQSSEYMSVAYQNIIPILTKAIQEQQTIINDLKARIETLEAK